MRMLNLCSALTFVGLAIFIIGTIMAALVSIPREIALFLSLFQNQLFVWGIAAIAMGLVIMILSSALDR